MVPKPMTSGAITAYVIEMTDKRLMRGKTVPQLMDERFDHCVYIFRGVLPRILPRTLNIMSPTI